MLGFVSTKRYVSSINRHKCKKCGYVIASISPSNFVELAEDHRKQCKILKP